jgi:hypothetical protein
MLVLATSPPGCSDNRELVAGDELTVFEGATLIDGNGGQPLPDTAIILSGQEVLHVGHVGDFRYPGGATVYDMSGRYIVPGFIDLHVHPRLGAEDDTMRMLLAFGITTVRIPGVGFDSPDELGLELRDRTANGTLAGPSVFTGGKIIEGPVKTFPDDVQVSSESEMRAEVRRQAARGVDLVKLYWNTPIEFIRAAVEEAETLNVQVVGHLRQTSWTEAARAGIDGLVHSAADGPTWELVPPERRDHLRKLPYRSFYRELAELIEPESPRFDALVNALVEGDVTVDPTLVNMQALYYGDDMEVLHRLEPEQASPAIVTTWGENWQEGHAFVLENVGGQELTHGKDLFGAALGIVKEFHERGVRIAAGTDVGMPWITPGVSFHRELELLTEVGIAPRQVLTIATKNGAEALESSHAFGTVEPGMQADLVVLRENPIDDIGNTRSIEVVYKQGKRYEPDTLLEELR